MLNVFENGSTGCNEGFSFHVLKFMLFDYVPESIEKSISRSGG